MENKKWLVGLVVLIIAIGALGYFGLKNNDQKSNDQAVAGESTSEPYFDENASVMFFYSDYCSWCLKEKEELTKLSSEGYKVKPMNTGENASYWTDYNIKGTPTFIAANGDRLEGYRQSGELKDWLDQHK